MEIEDIRNITVEVLGVPEVAITASRFPQDLWHTLAKEIAVIASIKKDNVEVYPIVCRSGQGCITAQIDVVGDWKLAKQVRSNLAKFTGDTLREHFRGHSVRCNVLVVDQGSVETWESTEPADEPTDGRHPKFPSRMDA